MKKESPRFLTIGVLGGMGPEATSHFFSQLVKTSDAARDQDHVPVVVCSFPQMPDRVDYILGNGRNPLPMLIQVTNALHRAGANFIIIPCITAHYFYSEIAACSPIPVVNIVGETASDVREKHPMIETVGLIATSATVHSRIFHDAFRDVGVSVVTPDDFGQKRVMEAIYGGIKAGKTGGASRKTILATASALIRKGAQAIIAGCTEIPIVLHDSDIPVPLIDPMRIAACIAIEKAGGKVRHPRAKGRSLKKCIS